MLVLMGEKNASEEVDCMLLEEVDGSVVSSLLCDFADGLRRRRRSGASSLLSAAVVAVANDDRLLPSIEEI